jgi:hypothetical protein
MERKVRGGGRCGPRQRAVPVAFPLRVAYVHPRMLFDLLSASLAAALVAVPGPGGAPARPQGPPADETTKGYAWTDVRLPDRAPFVGECFVVRLAGAVDVDVLEANLVQPFRQPLDVPVQLEHPWFSGSPARPVALGPARSAGAAAAAESGGAVGAVGASPSARVALGGELASGARRVEREPDGRRFTVVSFERTFVADGSAPLAVPAPRMGFAYANEFREDLIGGRVPVDRHDAFVLGEAKELAFRALPEAGRPYSFTGAVGRFTLDAELRPGHAAVGDDVELTVTVRADGPVGPYDAPALDRFPGFDVLGLVEEADGDERRFIVQLVPRSVGLLAVAPVEFTAFDPVREQYVRLATPNLTIEVAPAGDGGGAASREPGDAPRRGGAVVESSRSGPSDVPSAPRGDAPLPLLLVLAGIGALGLVAVVLARSVRRTAD